MTYDLVHPSSCRARSRPWEVPSSSSCTSRSCLFKVIVSLAFSSAFFSFCSLPLSLCYQPSRLGPNKLAFLSPTIFPPRPPNPVSTESVCCSQSVSQRSVFSATIIATSNPMRPRINEWQGLDVHFFYDCLSSPVRSSQSLALPGSAWSGYDGGVGVGECPGCFFGPVLLVLIVVWVPNFFGA